MFKLKFQGILGDEYTTLKVDPTDGGYRVLLNGVEVPNLIDYSVEFGSGFPVAHLTIAVNEVQGDFKISTSE